MAFVTKTWKDRLVEYAGRRRIKNVATGEETLVDVSRSEGTVSQAGDAFSAANMNNLEQRIKEEFDTVNSSLNGLSFAQDADGNWGYKVGADAVIPFKGTLKQSDVWTYTERFTTMSATFTTPDMSEYRFILLASIWQWSSHSQSSDFCIIPISEFKNGQIYATTHPVGEAGIVTIQYKTDTSIYVERGSRADLVLFFIK